MTRQNHAKRRPRAPVSWAAIRRAAWSASAACVLAVGAGHALAAAESEVPEQIVMSLDIVDMTYLRQGEAVVARIDAGDFAGAEWEAARMRELKKPQAPVVATTHQMIGFAYGKAERLEDAVAHLEEALRADDGTTPGLVVGSRAYLAYALTALRRYDAAERFVGKAYIGWRPWLFAKLAAVYADIGHHDCAVANGERALELARAGHDVPTRNAAGDSMDREAVLDEWSARLDAARQAAKSAAESGAQPPAAVCVGGSDPEDAEAQSPEQGR